MIEAIERAKTHSEKKLANLRESLGSLGIPAGEVVLTCGSYARREASGESDIDFFIITDKSANDVLDAEGNLRPETIPWAKEIRDEISKIVATDPAEGGAFAKVELKDAMLVNIGGDHDTNQKITRRMLFLLEGEWLYNESGFHSIRHQMLERYIGPGMTDHQLALFLLNDIIRYYRTMAVDYEFKTVEGESPKPWGIRNIKLVFSRKLLYASGVFSVALTADRSREEKIKILENLFSLPVVDRMEEICGRENFKAALQSYNYFMTELEKKETREKLNFLSREGRSDPLFRKLKNEGHNFTRELLKLFERTFDMTHTKSH